MILPMNNTPDPKNEAAQAFRAGNYAEAVRLFEQALEIEPDSAVLWHDLGQAYRAADRLGDAAEAFNKAAGMRDDFAEPLNSLGTLSRLTGNLDLAADYFHQALTRQPDYPEVYFNLAVLEEARGDMAAARRHYEMAMTLRENYLQAQNNLAALLTAEGEYDAAETLLRRALEASPNSAELLTTLGTCLRQEGRLGAARESYLAALKAREDFPEAHWNLALVQLAVGQFEDGWGSYRYRPSADRVRHPRPNSSWPANLAGERINLEGEQGLGDELFFLRFVLTLLDRGAVVSYQGDGRLTGMIERALPGLEKQDAISKSVSVADLPYLLGAIDTPQTLAITALEDKQEIIRGALQASGPPPYTGFTYRAGLTGEGSLFKQIPLEQVADVLETLPGTLLNLQRHPVEAELEMLANRFGERVLDFSDYNDDLEAMLALMSVLDDYIGVSNTNMHLRAASGRSAHVLVPHPAEYRWMADGASPWFPGFGVYRQLPDGSWTAALQSLSSDLGAGRG